MVENALRQHRAYRFAAALLARLVLGDELDLDRQARPGVRRQVVVAARLVQLGRAARQRHLQLQRLGLRLVEPAHYRLHFRAAVIFLGLVVGAQGGGLGALRRRQASTLRRAVGAPLNRESVVEG